MATNSSSTRGSGSKTPAQKTAEEKAAEDKAAAEKAETEAQAAREAEAQGKPTPSDDENTKNATSDVDGVADADEVQEQRDERGETVQGQRDAEAEARSLAEARARGDVDKDGKPVERSDEEKALLAAAPGGERTLLTGGTEGSTKVRDTAAYTAPPTSGPLHDPVNDITNLDARDDDPDNRVYGDAAGPRPDEGSVETQTRIVDGSGAAPKTRFVTEDGEVSSFDEMFETHEGKTFVTTKVRVYETFIFPNTVEEGRRLAYTAGRKVPISEAENVRRMLNGEA